MVCGFTAGLHAQAVKPPKAQLWLDLSTGTMAGMPEISREDVQKALEAAGVWDFVAAMPQGIC